MPVKIPSSLPARAALARENVFVMEEYRAKRQDIRPLRIGIVNLMPTKEVTETQLLRLLSNTSLQVEISLIAMRSHQSKNVAQDYLDAFYRSFEDIQYEKFDGFIITGAPVELLEFEEVDYWDELAEILRWTRSHVFSTLHICWAAQAGLHYHYGIGKHELSEKKFGVFAHRALNKLHPLVRGCDDVFYIPHSRHTAIQRDDINIVPELELLVESDEAGVLLVASRDGRQVYITGHAEYDADTLDKEYKRDISKGLAIDVPRHYYPLDDPSRIPQVSWRAHANLLFANWLNYFVYQETPYNLSQIDVSI